MYKFGQEIIAENSGTRCPVLVAQYGRYIQSLRNIEATIWQLQLFGRITSHITRQLQLNNIPILRYLNEAHGIVLKGSAWHELNKELEREKIPPDGVINYLRRLVQ